MDIRTIRDGQEYRAVVGGKTLVFERAEGEVAIFSARGHFGRWSLDRFGGTLSPASIREFLEA
ncbi:hypothetical protein ACWF99_23720 [Nocardia sp. NPDC055002]